VSLPALHLALASVGVLLALNARWPTGRWLGLNLASFFAGWLTAELVPVHVAWLSMSSLYFVMHGTWRTPIGQLALVLTAVAVALLVHLQAQATRAGEAVLASLSAAQIEGQLKLPAAWAPSLWVPWPRRPRGVQALRNLVYDDERGLVLDAYLPGGGERRPALVFVHGGGWILGHRWAQGLPLMWHFAAAGWACFSVQYRLAPRATFPAPLEDVKRAIAWLRKHAERFAIDPDDLSLAGGSAGAHLAALAALDPSTRAKQCLTFYGVYDVTNSGGHWRNPGLALLWRLLVLRQSLARAPELYAQASPVLQVGPNAPPFFIVHGTHDTLVPIEDARRFAAALRAAGAAAVLVEVRHGQHAFDIFPSLRCLPVVQGALLFAEAIRANRTRPTPSAGLR
jgi:acetyl esterase/lipase